jgi:predicted amidohydrolase YtcJ
MVSNPHADVVDLERKTVMPGIIESHGHLLSLGQSFLELNVKVEQTYLGGELIYEHN